MADSLDQGRPVKRIKLAPHPQPAYPHPRPRPRLDSLPQQQLIEPTTPLASTGSIPLSWVHVVPATRGGRRHRNRNRNRGLGRGGGGASTSGSDAARALLQAPVEIIPLINSALNTGSPASTISESSLISTSTSTSPRTPHEQIQPMQPVAATEVETVLVPQDISASPPPEESIPRSLSHISSFDLQPHTPRDLATPATNLEQLSPSPVRYGHNSRKRRHEFISPFKDCIGTFGELPSLRFSRPTDGMVNSYIKFNWPKRRTQSGRSYSTSAATQSRQVDDDENEHTRPSTQSSSALVAANYSSAQTSPQSTPRQLYLEQQGKSNRSLSFPGSTPPSTISSPSSSIQYARSWDPRNRVWVSNMARNAPQMLPPHFGLTSQMDTMDRRFFEFYIGNWCPGRSILGKTNLWLQDFASMEGSKGVLCAIQSLAGIYVYDYQPLGDISRRINLRFYESETRLSELLEKIDLSTDEASELITILCILSMQDIILPERRCKRPEVPRWLRACELCEHFLDSIDEGSRFWRNDNVQLSSLRNSQSIFVGRAIILSQIMTPLPPPSAYDPQREANRFGWLLYGNDQDMYEIHGGCGFSKKLLHSMNQITSCAAWLTQCPETPVVPLTTRFILSELLDMRQWSSAPNSHPFEIAQTQPQTIEWVCAAQEGYVISNATDMTEVTAEAWRIAAVIYLQCRTLRLPRNHPDVLANLTYLAKCINIMPTSGYHFTAQAPLFPVFLLGMLATVSDHVVVAQTWFDKVTSTPVRSSVPPLYEALKRIWMWIDTDPNLALPVNSDLDDDVFLRHPWWEHLVQRVQEEEEEILCLT